MTEARKPARQKGKQADTAPGKSSRPKSGGPKSGGKGTRSGSAPSTRQLRVGEEIRHVLAACFARGEFRDPDLSAAQLTVSEVRTSPDLRHATVFVSRLGRSDVEALLPALRRASVFLRGKLAQSMKQQRMVPELHFQADEALEYASHVDKLLKQPDVARDLKDEANSSN